MPSDSRPRTNGSARPYFPAHASHGPTRTGRPDEVHCDTLSLDPFARLTLALMRWHFLSFAQPDSHGWLMALRLATAHIGPRRAGGAVL